MELNIKWHKPINLLDGHKQNLIYTANGIESWQGVPGVYMFCRLFGSKTIPLYIGKAEDIAVRINQHFNTSTKLMKGISNPNKGNRGKKVLVVGQFTPKSGQSTKKCITIIERALIVHALAEGHDLLNVQGTKTPTNRIHFSGNLGARSLTGKLLSVAIAKSA